ncbi:hypothetical protein BSNK01_18550 [Bacillaceae bacterium]
MQIEHSLDLPVRICFPVLGRQVPVDHHEALYAAVSRERPRLHGLEGLALSPIIGGEAAGNQLKLNRDSRVFFQLPPQSIHEVIGLAGRRLLLTGEQIRLGVPQLYPIVPSRTLFSKYCTSRNAMDEERMKERICEELKKMGVTWQNVTITLLRRRVIQIHDKKIVGWGVRLSGLSANDSLLIQMRGIGGRRRYGGGFFLPVRGEPGR